MKPFENLKLAYQYLNSAFNGYATMQWLETKLKALVTPDVEGVALNSIGDYNIQHDGQGNIIIQVTKLEDEIEIGTGLLLKNETGTPKVSTDGGVTWVAVALQDAIDALPNWDTDNDDIVDLSETSHGLMLGDGAHAASEFLRNAANDAEGVAAKAEELDDGVNTATAADVRAHLDNVAIHVGGYLSVSNYVRNQFLQISDLATTRHEFLDGWADSFITGESLDPASEEYFLTGGKIKNLGEVDVYIAPVSGWTTYGTFHAYHRSRIPVSALLAGAGKVAVKLKAGNTYNEVWIGNRNMAGAMYEFDGNQVQMFMAGANPVFDAEVWSEFSVCQIDPAKDVLVAVSQTAGLWRYNTTCTGHGYAQTNEVPNSSAYTVPAGGGPYANYIADIVALKGMSSGLASLLFLPYAAPAAPSAGRCLIHINPIESVTPGTDITVHQAADNAAPVWEEFGTIAAQDLADGTVLLDAEAAFGNSGTTPTLKIETPTGKEIEILAVEHFFTL